MRSFFRIVLVCFFCITAAVPGNIAGFSEGKGGIIIPVKNDQISMESETITILVNKLDWRAYELVYQCHFVFKNNSQTDQQVLMGFPVDYDYDLEGSDFFYRNNLTNHITAFSLTVNKEITAYRKYMPGLNPDLKEIEQYDELYGFSASFKPGEQKEMAVACRMPLHKGGWREDAALKYILKSALSWEKPVKKVQIAVKFNFPIVVSNTKELLEIRPAGYVIADKGRTIAFAYSNYKPADDLYIRFYEKEQFPYTTPILMSSFTDKYRNPQDIMPEEDGSLYFAYKKIYETYLAKAAPDKIKRLRYAVPAYHGYTGDDRIFKYMNGNFYNPGQQVFPDFRFEPDKSFEMSGLGKEELLLFEHLGKENAGENPFSFNSRLNELIKQLEADAAQVDFYNLIRCLGSIAEYKLTGVIFDGVIRRARDAVEQYCKKIMAGADTPFYLMGIIKSGLDDCFIISKESALYKAVDKKYAVMLDKEMQQNRENIEIIMQALLLNPGNREYLHAAEMAEVLIRKDFPALQNPYREQLDNYYHSVFDAVFDSADFQIGSLLEIEKYMTAYFDSEPCFTNVIAGLAAEINNGINIDADKKKLEVLLEYFTYVIKEKAEEPDYFFAFDFIINDDALVKQLRSILELPD